MGAASQGLLARVPEVLAWSAPADPGGALRRRAQAEIRARLEGQLRASAPAEVVDQLLGALDALPAAGRARLLGSPALVGQVMLDFGLDLDRLDEAIRAAARAPVTRRLRRPILDLDSPFARERVPFIVERFVPYDELDAAWLRGRVRAALAELRGTLAGALVRGFTRVIVARSKPELDGWLSESTEGVLGRTLLLNAERAEPVALAEALVHEAVHAWLSTIELFEPMLPNRDGVAGLAPVSPWTGAVLDAPRLAHACWVWYALLHLRRARGDEAGASTLLAGFQSERLRAGLAELGPWLSPGARPIFELLNGVQ